MSHCVGESPCSASDGSLGLRGWSVSTKDQ